MVGGSVCGRPPGVCAAWNRDPVSLRCPAGSTWPDWQGCVRVASRGPLGAMPQRRDRGSGSRGLRSSPPRGEPLCGFTAACPSVVPGVGPHGTGRDEDGSEDGVARRSGGDRDRSDVSGPAVPAARGLLRPAPPPHDPRGNAPRQRSGPARARPSGGGPAEAHGRPPSRGNGCGRALLRRLVRGPVARPTGPASPSRTSSRWGLFVPGTGVEGIP